MPKISQIVIFGFIFILAIQVAVKFSYWIAIIQVGDNVLLHFIAQSFSLVLIQL